MYATRCWRISTAVWHEQDAALTVEDVVEVVSSTLEHHPLGIVTVTCPQ